MNDVLSKVQDEMKREIRTRGAPEDVREFLMRDWSRLLTGIFLAKGNQHGDWKAGWETAHALLWSLAPKQDRLETLNLLRILPTLLERLHAGCTALALEATARDALFERLALLHAAVVRAGLHARGDAEGPETRLGGADTEVAASLAGLAAPGLPARLESGAMPVLKLGDRVVFTGEGGERQRVLTWVSPLGGMYLLTNEQGFDALTLTHARLEAKFQAGEARLVV